MAVILNIETSTTVCSVALSRDGQCVFSRRNDDGGQHGTLLGVYVDEALQHAKVHLLTLDAVCVSKGPGSYTGLRIGVSLAKGVCYGQQVPLLAVPTTEVLCVPLLLYRHDIDTSALFCPMIDARRMEVYSALYDAALRPVREVEADVVTADTYRPWLDEHVVYFFGNGAAKCKEVIAHPNARFIEDIVPDAKHMFPLAEKRYWAQQWEDVAYFTPFYLKDFVAKPARDLLHMGK
ncbi:MAG: tRNA (adenosine(37)-N6)-threonylcarbamoyltransferase complex dimerization subunit type 1 TsaB [Bacteroidaceae bacterium]|nr:tRNA (adenosine(37)-N6)-threonylcarbamoyltransferase complex dimerization subunit type 1 TsaB [Bacteroidaceae bacterium]